MKNYKLGRLTVTMLKFLGVNKVIRYLQDLNGAPSTYRETAYTFSTQDYHRVYDYYRTEIEKLSDYLNLDLKKFWPEYDSKIKM